MIKTADLEKVFRKLAGPLPQPEQMLGLADSLFDQGNYNLAALLYYRLLDLTVTEFLQARCPFTGWEQPPYDQLAQPFQHLKQQLLGPAPASRLPWRPGFSDQCILIHLLYPARLNQQQLQAVITAANVRHNSWLAHGTQRVGKQSCTALRQLTQAILNTLKEG